MIAGSAEQLTISLRKTYYSNIIFDIEICAVIGREEIYHYVDSEQCIHYEV